MTSQDQFDYCLVNKNLTQAVKDLKDIIVQKIKDYRGE
jgi:guanylate kinase